MHKVHKGENKPGSHSYSSINNFTGHFFILKRKLLFGIVGRRALNKQSDHCAMNSSWRRRNWNCQHGRCSWLALAFSQGKSVVCHIVAVSKEYLFLRSLNISESSTVFSPWVSPSARYRVRDVACTVPFDLHAGLMRAVLLNRLFLLLSFGRSGVSDSLRPHGLQHARPPCLSPTPWSLLTHVHWVGDAIQPSHPLSSPSPPALNLSQHQGLFQWVSSSYHVAKVLEFQL